MADLAEKVRACMAPGWALLQPAPPHPAQLTALATALRMHLIIPTPASPVPTTATAATSPPPPDANMSPLSMNAHPPGVAR